MHLSRQALADVLEQFAPERVRLVLAATLCDKVYDGRFSAINRAWARAVPLPKVEPNSFHNPLDMYVLSTHPAILDGFVSLFIRSVKF